MATIVKITQSDFRAITQWDDDGAYSYDMIYQIVPDPPVHLDSTSAGQGAEGPKSEEEINRDKAELMPAA